MLPCGVEKNLIRCHMAWLKPSLCVMWHVIYNYHMAWYKPYLIAIWHVLDLTYVPCGMVRFNIGPIWHG